MLIVMIMTFGFIAIAYVGCSVVEVAYSRPLRMRRLGVIATPSVNTGPQGTEKTDLFPTVSRMIAGKGWVDKLLLELTRAGIRLRPSEYVGAVSAIALISAAVASWLFGTALAMIPAVFAIVAGSHLHVKNMQRRRLVAFSRQLPDALLLISAAIRSGYSFPRAMQMVSEEMPAPISDEFARAMNEMNVGLSVEATLNRMLTRIPSYDLELVVTAVAIQQEVGGNLAEVLGHIDSTIRDRVRVEGEIGVLTAEGRVSGIVLVAMPFALAVMILIVNPKYLKPLLDTGWGIWVLVGAVAMQGLGALIIKKMLAVDY